jgi:hypothetical protein
MNCQIFDNTGENGTGIKLIGEIAGVGKAVGGTYTGNSIHNNTAILQGGGINVWLGSASLVITDNLVYENSALHGGGMFLEGILAGGTVSRNTVVENSASAAGPGMMIAGDSVVVERTIVAFNLSTGIATDAINCASATNAEVNCSVIWNPTLSDLITCGGTDNQVADPQFCGELGSFNYELQLDSPATGGSCGLIGAKDIGCGNTAVAILSFRAVAERARVRLASTFSSDLTMMGVNVYRGEGDGPIVGYDRLSAITDGSLEYIDTKVDAGGTYRYRIGVIDDDGEFLSPVMTVSIPIGQLRLEQNRPNPFNPSTDIRFTLAERGRVRLNVYNARGERVATLVDQVMSAGDHTASWAARGMPSGIYFYSLVSGKQSLTRKMVLLK